MSVLLSALQSPIRAHKPPRSEGPVYGPNMSPTEVHCRLELACDLRIADCFMESSGGTNGGYRPIADIAIPGIVAYGCVQLNRTPVAAMTIKLFVELETCWFGVVALH